MVVFGKVRFQLLLRSMSKRRREKSIEKYVGSQIKMFRTNMDITQEVAAERCGLSWKYFARCESGQNLTLTTLAKIANALNVNVAELLPGERLRADKPLEAEAKSLINGMAERSLRLAVKILKVISEQ